LARLPVDVFVVGTAQAAAACQQASQTIPIVIAYVDPVETGLVTSLARPGAQITGTASMTAGLPPSEWSC
jgi:putative ABC transport system substrate-binding protein